MKCVLGRLVKAYFVFAGLLISGLVEANEWEIHSFENSNCCEPPQCAWGYNPPAYITCCDQMSGFTESLKIEADFLWWRASSSGVDLGESETIFLSIVPPPIHGPFQTLGLKRANGHFQPGFRVGVDFVNPCYGCDAGVYYTHFNSKITTKAFSDVVATGTNTTVTSFHPFEETIGFSVPDVAEGRWKLDLDYIDFEIAHKYYVSKYFVLRPYLGLRGARINQSYTYSGFADREGAFFIGQSSNHFVSTNKLVNNFLGLGPRIGFDIEVELGCGLAIFGEAAGSMVFGRFERHSNETYTDFSPLNLFAGVPFKFNQHAPSERNSGSITDLAIGLEWDHCFCLCGKEHPLNIALSWEHHGFYGFAGFGFNEGSAEYSSVAPPSTAFTENLKEKKRGNLFTQGLTVRANYGF